MIKKICMLGSVLLLATACSSTGGAGSTPKVQAMQKKDKQLSCKEILLEMNEAEFYKGMANKNKGPRLKNVLMPLGYISTYMNAEEAIEASNARVSYLDKVYDIMGCEEEGMQATTPQHVYAPAQGYQVPNYGAVNGYGVMPQQYQRQPQAASMPMYESYSEMSATFPGYYAQ
jgi:hypothetical protein